MHKRAGQMYGDRLDGQASTSVHVFDSSVSGVCLMFVQKPTVFPVQTLFCHVAVKNKLSSALNSAGIRAVN